MTDIDLSRHKRQFMSVLPNWHTNPERYVSIARWHNGNPVSNSTYELTPEEARLLANVLMDAADRSSAPLEVREAYEAYRNAMHEAERPPLSFTSWQGMGSPAKPDEVRPILVDVVYSDGRKETITFFVEEHVLMSGTPTKWYPGVTDCGDDTDCPPWIRESATYSINEGRVTNGEYDDDVVVAKWHVQPDSIPVLRQYGIVK